MKNFLSNFSGIQKETDIAIITLDDNIVHTYCAELMWQKDNSTPIGIAKVKIPYDTSIEKYWVKYSGTVVVHANLRDRDEISQNDYATQMQMPNKTIVQSHQDDKIRLQNDQYNYSFIGKVHRFKQEGKKFVLYLEDLGWKFMQKVPTEFRQNYIAGQTLDNAFQAICESMGVEFAYSIEKLSEYNFAADGYSIEKDGSIIESVPSIFEGIKEDAASQKTEDEKMADRITGDQPFEAPGLIDYLENQQLSNQSNNQSLNQTITNQPTQRTESEIQENNPKIQEYQEEFDKKFQDLFKGNTLYDSNISDAIINYNWIKVTPTAQTTATDTTNEEANNERIQTDTSTNSQLNAETE